MITHARWGQWETNSSSIHQAIIHRKDPQLTDKPENLIVRKTDVDLGSYTTSIEGAQFKLDFVVGCILSSSKYGDKSEGFYYLLSLVSMLQDYGVSVEIDKDSFKESAWASVAEEITDQMTTMSVEDADKLARFLFDPASEIRSVNNNDVNELGEYKYLLNESDPSYNDFDVITDHY